MKERRKLDIRDIPDSQYLIKFVSNIRIDNQTRCWNWVASKDSSGYGAFFYESKYTSSHIYIMKITNRYIDGLYVDHKCRNKSCCNPDHLRMVTPRTNVVENNSSPAFENSQKTHCKYNHPFNKENTGSHTNKKTGRTTRVCLECKRERRNNSLSKYGYKN